MKRISLLILATTLLAATGCDQTKTSSTPVKDARTDVPVKIAEIPVTSKSPQAVALFEEGRMLADNVKFPQALPKFEEAVKLDPTFAQAHAYLAGFKAGAESDAHAKKADANSASLPAIEKAFIQYHLAARKGDHDAAARHLDTLLKDAANSWRVQETAGFYYVNRGHAKKGTAALEQSTQLNPTRVTSWNMLAYLYSSSGEYDKAIAAANKQVALAPKEPNVYDTKADMLLMAGKFAEAEASYAKALQVDPKFAMAHSGIAATHFYRDNWDTGLAELAKQTKATVNPQQRGDSIGDEVLAHAGAGRFKQAHQLIDGPMNKAHQESKVASGWNGIWHGLIYAHQGNWKKAHQAAKPGWKSIEGHATKTSPKVTAAALHTEFAARAGDVATAKQRLAFIEKVAPGGAEATFAKAYVAWGEGNTDEAVKLFSEVKNPNWSPNARIAAADALLAAGKKAEATQRYQEIATSDYGRFTHAVLAWQKATKALKTAGTTARK